MKKFRGVRRLAAFAILFTMIFANVPSLLAAGPTTFPLTTNTGYYVADADTMFFTEFTQDTATKKITATVYLQNNSATQTLYISGAGFVVAFTDKIAPVDKNTGLPYYGGAKVYSTSVFEYGDFIPGCKFNSISSQVVRNDATARILGGMLTSSAEGDFIVLAPGQKEVIYNAYFMPANGTDAMNLSMFSYAYQSVSLRKVTTWVGNGAYFMVADARLATGSDTYVLYPQAFKLLMDQNAPSTLSANNSARTVTNYDPALMEWSKSPDGPFTSAAPTAADIGPGAAKIYVRYAGTDYTGSDPPYTNYKKLLASPVAEVDFSSAGLTDADVAITKTSSNITSADGYTHVGDTVRYTVTASNNGHADTVWAGVKATDTLPEYVSFVQNSIKIGGAPAGMNGYYDPATRTITVNLGNISGGATKTVTFDVTVDAGAYGQGIENFVSVYGKNSDQPGATDVGGEVSDNGGFEVAEKSDAPTIDPIVEGDTDVTGKGVPGATVTVDFPDGTSKTATVNGNGDWKVTPDSPMKAGDEIAARQKEPGKDMSDDADATVGPRPASKLSIEKTSKDTTSADGKLHVNDTIEYTIKAGNSAADTRALLTDVVVTDILPDGVKLVDGSVKIDGAAAGTALTVTTVNVNGVARTQLAVSLPDLAGGEYKTITFKATINADAYGKNIKNAATVAAKDSGEDKTETTDDGDQPPKDVTPQSDKPTINDLTAGDTAITGEGVPGSKITVTFPDGSKGDTTVDPDGTWTIDTPEPLKDNEEVQAVQTTPGKDPSEPEIAYVGQRPDPKEDIQKTSEDKASPDGKYRVNDLIDYTIVITNTGDPKSLMTGIVVKDELPDGVTLVNGSVKIDGAAAGSALQIVTGPGGRPQLVITLPDLLGGAHKTVTFQATVDADAYGKDITNSASVETDNGGDGDDKDKDDPVIVPGKSAEPTIDDVYVGDRVITGTGIPKAQITVSLPNVGPLPPVRVNDDGTWSVDVPPYYNLLSGQVIAAVQLDDTDPTADNAPSDPVTTVVNGTPKINGDTDLSVVKSFENLTSTDGIFRVGDVIRYTIVTTNNGHPKSVWKNPALTDVIPASLILDRDSVLLNDEVPTVFSYLSSTRVLTVRLGDIAGGGGYSTVVFEATIADSSNGLNVMNSVTVTGVDAGSGDILSKTANDGGYDVQALSENPTIDYVTRGDPAITGKGVPEAEIVVTFPNGETATTTVDPDGNWSVDVPADVDLKNNDEITAVQTEDGKGSSPEVTAPVHDKQYRAVTGLASPMAVEDYGLGDEFLSKFYITAELRPTFSTPASADMSAIAVWTGDQFTGRFTIENVPFGTYVLYISTPGYLARCMVITVSASDPDLIELTPPDGSVFWLQWGDCNGDYIIDGRDTMLLLDTLNNDFFTDGYLPSCDLNRDGVIDGRDTMLVLDSLNLTVFDYPGADTVNFDE
ncbi:MAG: Ig-like domain-containing protein [Firmicutes bacterium]|nr:Ig-like domain-containing protein [Bacillota bacterium]